TDGRYLLVGAPARLRDRLPAGDGLPELLDDPLRHWVLSSVPMAERRHHEVSPLLALEFLVRSGYADDLPDDLQRLLEAHLSPGGAGPACPTCDDMAVETSRPAADQIAAALTPTSTASTSTTPGEPDPARLVASSPAAP